MRVHYRTFGCKTNQYDTERMRQALEVEGVATDLAESPADADVCVVNTCTVTHQADADARRFVRRARRENPSLKVVVAGCSAALQGAVYRALPEVSGVVEGHDPEDVLREVEQALGLDPSPVIQLGSTRPLDRAHLESVGASVLTHRAGATRGWLKVQDGCDRKCSFCATRLARGVSRSRDPELVVREALALSKSHPELVVTGVHIGHYGRDLGDGMTLSRLLARLLHEVPGPRFRLGSIEATEVDDLLLELLETAEGHLAPHLHMPLQSGADPVLHRMRRWHTREMYRSRALEIASRVGSLGLGADVITGFPGETDADHEATRTLVEELPFTYLHVFPYSPRLGTPAAGLPDRISPAVSKERAAELRGIGERKKRDHARRRGRARVRVVMEGTGGTALTEDYLRVLVEGPQGDPRRLQEGRLSEEGTRVRIDLPPARGMN